MAETSLTPLCLLGNSPEGTTKWLLTGNANAYFADSED